MQIETVPSCSSQVPSSRVVIQNIPHATPKLQELLVLLGPHMLTPWREKLYVPGCPSLVYEGMCQIVPKVAETLLKSYNPMNNRNISDDKVQLENVLLEDRWNPDQPDSTGVFGRDGYIKNFQHRLRACVAADLPFSIRLEINHDDRILLAMDQTFPRTEAQQARVLGRDSGESRDYASVKFMWMVQNQKTYFPFERGTKTYDLIDHEYPNHIWSIVPTRSQYLNKALVHPIRSALLLLAIRWPTEVAEFVRQLDDPRLQVLNGGPYMLLRYMMNPKHVTEKQTYLGKWSMLRRTFKAFHLFLEEKTITRLRDSLDSLVELFSQIDPDWVLDEDGPLSVKGENSDDKERGHRNDC
jgi:hypothetical protein